MENKKFLLKCFLLSVGYALLSYCGSSKEQVREEPKVTQATAEEPKATEPKPVVQTEAPKTLSKERLNELNQKLSKATMFGFGNGKTELSEKQEKAWLNKNLDLFKGIAQEIAPVSGLSLEVRGHSSSRLAPKPKYIVISREEAALKRAQYALELLQKNGVDTSRFVAVGKKDSEPLNPQNPKDGKNRRVSFHLVTN